MGNINVARWFIGGIVAGIVMNVIDFVTYGFLLSADMTAWAHGLHIDPALMNSSSSMATFVVSDLLLGLVLIWIYVTMRPRFGPGPKTAVIAALTFFVTIELATFGLTSMGIFTTAFFFKTALFALVCRVVSGLAGAAVYKE